VPGMEPRAITIPLPDGDELWNAAQVGQHLGIGATTVWGYASKHLPRNHPFPEPEGDPVALVVHDPVQAAAVRLLMAADARVARGQSAPEPPRLWRASQVRAWNSGRAGRGNWRA
jgi:hypothetical protein